MHFSPSGQSCVQGSHSLVPAPPSAGVMKEPSVSVPAVVPSLVPSVDGIGLVFVLGEVVGLSVSLLLLLLLPPSDVSLSVSSPVWLVLLVVGLVAVAPG